MCELRFIKILFTIGLAFLFITNVNSQSKDNNITFKLNVDTSFIKLKHKFLLINSLSPTIDGITIDKTNFFLSNDTLFLNQSYFDSCKGKEIQVSYRAFPYDISQRYSLLDTQKLIRKDYAIYIGYDLTPETYNKNNKIIDSKSLDYNGSFSRGFSVGNAQSLVVNSKFDMQLQGEIGNGIKISAAISDDNIPIQPEGNTQVLQEFDRVFIELSKNKTNLMAGDFVIKRPNSYFMNYLKKVQGIGFNIETTFKNKKLTSSGNIATSRGKFARQTIPNKEGNQGPYKLNGNNNERYIIILSGTEKIYFNGELLRRGLDFDYIIDYNLAEIVFSPNRLISRETRIIAEFEYTDQNYYRTLYTTGLAFENKKTTLGFNFYSEQDSKKSFGQADLDSNSIDLLERVGDDEQAYAVSSIRQLAADRENTIKYELIKNPNFPIDKNEYFLIFSSDETQLLYSAFFSETKQNEGSYIIDPSVSVNGRVYKFVGQNNGNYEPINRLVPPEQKQMLNLSYNYKLGKKGNFNSDLSMTNFDKNRFAEIGDADNIGFAAFFNFSNESLIEKDSLDSLSMIYGIAFENTGAQFKPLNQYRSAEYLRDWNYTPPKVGANEKILKGNVGLINSKNKFNILFNRFDSGNNFKGNNLGLDVDYIYKGFKILALPTVTYSDYDVFQSKFFRPNFKISQFLPSLNSTRLGVELESEDNRKTNTSSLLLDSTSYSFYYLKSYIGFGEDKDFAWRISYNKREDNFATQSNLKKALDIQEIELNSKYVGSDISTFNLSLKLRDYKVVDNLLAPNEKSKLTLLGSIDHGFSWLKKSLIGNTNYIVNSGQEPKLEFVFQKVENLRGDYVYVGSDTAIVKNINDFRYDPSNPLASYVKFVIPNNEFTTTNNISLNHSLRIEPAKYWLNDTSKQNSIVKLIKKITNNSIFRIAKKSASSNAEFNYFDFNTIDTSLVSYQKNIVSTTMFNRGNPKYDFSYIYRNNGTKNNQINGFESRDLLENEFKTRINLFSNFDFFLSYIGGKKTFSNKLFTNRNFIINSDRYNAEVSWRPSTKMRVNAKYSRNNNRQTINLLENSTKNEYTFTFNQRTSNTSSLDVSFSFIDVSYNGEINSLIQYDILESLLPGSNYLWSLNYTRRLSKLVDLVFSYEGRKTGLANVINVGRVQAKATF